MEVADAPKPPMKEAVPDAPIAAAMDTLKTY